MSKKKSTRKTAKKRSTRRATTRVAGKKPARKKSTRKKAATKKAARKKSTRKKTATRKTARKKSTRKKSTRKKTATRKTARKKSTRKKTAKKRTTRRATTRVAGKKAARKKSTRKKGATRKTSRKKSTRKKAAKTSRRAPSRAAAAAKDPALASSGATCPTIDAKTLERERKTGIRLAERERRNRLADYDRAVAEAQGVSAGAPVRAGRAGAAPTRVTARRRLPVRILAEGDSWFDFPFGGRPFQNGDVIAKLASLIRVPILNQAVRGDEVRQILGVEQRQRLEQLLNDQRRDFNALLFSGGGNDIVGDPLCLWIRQRDAVDGDPDFALDETALAHAFGIVRAGYEQLFDMRDAAVAATPGRRIAVFFHAYDFAIPSGDGVCGFGPWLKPSLDYRGWTNPREARAIVRMMLARFGAMLRDLAARRDDAHYVRSQGTLNSRDWHDELHPTGGGFKKIARKFERSLSDAFPGRLR